MRVTISAYFFSKCHGSIYWLMVKGHRTLVLTKCYQHSISLFLIQPNGAMSLNNGCCTLFFVRADRLTPLSAMTVGCIKWGASVSGGNQNCQIQNESALLLKLFLLRVPLHPIMTRLIHFYCTVCAQSCLFPFHIVLYLLLVHLPTSPVILFS